VHRVEVIPRHLVDPNGHHRLEHGVEPRRHIPSGRELVEIEDRGMGVVEDQWVSERFMPRVVRGVVSDQREEPLVDLAGLVEVVPQFGPLGGDGIVHRGVRIEANRPSRCEGQGERGECRRGCGLPCGGNRGFQGGRAGTLRHR